MNIKFLTKNLFNSLIIVLLFAAADYFFHQLSAEYSVPPRYFPNKIIYGTIFLFISLWVFSRLSLWRRSFLSALIVSALLQARYFFEGYPLDFVLIFLFIHFIILFLLCYWYFKIVK